MASTTEQTDNEYLSCERLYNQTQTEHRLKLLMTIAIGLSIEGHVIDSAAFDNESIFPTKNKKRFKPCKIFIEKELSYTAVLQLNKYTKPLNTSYICTIKYNRLRIH